MAPLLYSLLRSLRPRSVIEVGIGSTTPFLLRALADNRADYQLEKKDLLQKTRIAASKPEDPDTPEQWFMSSPLGANPAHYLQDYQPHLHAFDDFSGQYSSAPRVLEVINDLGLQAMVTVSPNSPLGQSSIIADRHRPIDLAWNDAANYRDFFDEYWPLINPEGGMMAFHNTVNACPQAAMFVKDLKLRQIAHFDDYELLSFLEPHKMNQNSFTLVRKTSEFKDRIMSWELERIKADSLALLKHGG